MCGFGLVCFLLCLWFLGCVCLIVFVWFVCFFGFFSLFFFLPGTCCLKCQFSYCPRGPSEHAVPKPSSLFVGHQPKSMSGWVILPFSAPQSTSQVRREPYPGDLSMRSLHPALPSSQGTRQCDAKFSKMQHVKKHRLFSREITATCCFTPTLKDTDIPSTHS